MPRAIRTDSSQVNAQNSSFNLASGSVIVMIGLLGGAFLQYSYNIGLPRLFGAKQTGDFVFCLSIVSIGAIIGQLGAQELLLRYIAAYRGSADLDRLKSVILVGVTIGIFGSGLFAILVYYFAPQISTLAGKPHIVDLLRTMCLFVPLLAAITMFGAALQSAKKMKNLVIIREIGRPLAIVVGLLCSWIFILRFENFIWITAAGLFLVVALAIKFLWSEFSDARESIGDISQLWSWIIFSLSVMFLDLFRSTTGWIDMLILGFFVPSEEIAIYFAAVRLALLITIVLGAFNAVLSPVAADLWHRQNIKELDAMFKQTTRWTAFAIIPIALSLYLVSSQLMALFGPEYQAAQSILAVIIIGRTVNGLTGGVTRLLMMTGHQRVELVNTIVTTILMVTGMIWASRTYGMFGVAVVSSAVVIVMNIIKLLEVHWLIGIQPYTAQYAKLGVAAIVAFIAGFTALNFLPNSLEQLMLFIVPFFTVITYLFIWYLLGIEDEDWVILNRLPRLNGKSLSH